MLIGIDPGSAGGIAWKPEGGHANAMKMPDTEAGVVNLIRELREIAERCHEDLMVLIEKVSGFAGDAQPGSAMFVFGCGYGVIRGALLALKIPFEDVTPQSWQKVLGLGSSGRIPLPRCPRGHPPAGRAAWRSQHAEEIRVVQAHNATVKREWKTKLKGRAEQLYPHLRVIHATADALLILHAATIRYPEITTRRGVSQCQQSKPVSAPSNVSSAPPTAATIPTPQT